MPSNVEIKAKVKDFDRLKEKARELSGSEETIIEQKDIFFNVPQGRLKLRFLQDQPCKLIYYERDDESGPKVSDYRISFTDKPDELADILTRALGVKGIVKKKRLLYLVGQTRVHCDDVEGLGHFMELESVDDIFTQEDIISSHVMMNENQSVSAGEEIAKDLMLKLEIEQDDLVKGAYIDLLSSKQV